MTIFYNCPNLTEVLFSDSITEIGVGAFDLCEELSVVTLPASLKSIGGNAFYGTNLSCIIIPDSVVSIGSLAFGLTNITTIFIPATETELSENAFSECYYLQEIVVDSSNPNYFSDSYCVLFNKDMSRLIQAPNGLSGYYDIPSSVCSIRWGAFS